jgi:hypothetical protein
LGNLGRADLHPRLLLAHSMVGTVACTKKLSKPTRCSKSGTKGVQLAGSWSAYFRWNCAA